MLRIRTRLLLIALGTALSAAAQVTWHGLSFDMSEEDVAKALLEYKLQPSPDKSARFTIRKLDPDYVFKGQESDLIFPFEVRLLFSKRTGKLVTIDMSMKFQPPQEINPVYLSIASSETYDQ